MKTKVETSLLMRGPNHSARRFALAAIGIATVLAGLLAMGRSSEHGVRWGAVVAPVPGQGGPAESGVLEGSSVQGLYAIDPSYVEPSMPERFARAMASPAFGGVLRGRTGVPTSRTLGTERRSLVVTDYPFTVLAFHGPRAAPYTVGSAITLRVPGGTSGQLQTMSEDAPDVAPGREMFVFVRDQGTFFGGNTPTTLVVSAKHDVVDIQNGMAVGRGALAGYTEPVAAFVQHFRAP